MRCAYDAVLFDLDGTLIQSHPGILRCARLALQEMGLPAPPEPNMLRFIGPPLWHSFTTLCGLTPEQAEEAVARFRTHYRAEGFLECAVYPGVLSLLNDLRSAGAKLAVATAKPHSMALAVCGHFGISPCVDLICGNREDEKGMGKRGLIENACLGLGVPPAKAAMVGDTRFDCEGAEEAGCAFFGVSFGYGSETELRAAGAGSVAASADGLRPFLFRRGTQP